MLHKEKKLAFFIPTPPSSKNRNTSSPAVAATAPSNPTLGRVKEQQMDVVDKGLIHLNQTMRHFNKRLGHALATFAGKSGSTWVDYTKGSMPKKGSSSSRSLDDLDGSLGPGKNPPPPHEEKLASYKKGCWLEVLGSGIRLWRVPALEYSERGHNLEEWSFAMQSVLLAFKYILEIAKA